ncbi:hypothetical protein MMC10_008609 [Thelotrema lepadinum]|nr:hypothetical protein [Thelotrema lepadinum]
METIRGLNSNGPAIIATALVFPILTTMTFVLRLATKHFTNAPFGADDWLLFAALDIYIIAEALVIRSAFIGREAASSDDPKYLTYLQYVYVYSVFYWIVIALAQASILSLYYRISGVARFKYTSLVLIGVVAAWGIVASIIEIGYPGHPINYYFGGSAGTVFNVTYLTFWLAMSIIEQVVNVTILALPIPLVMKLQLTQRTKFGLATAFLLGGFVITTGIVRIVTLYHPTAAGIDLTQGDIWLNVHLGVAIICASLPIVRILHSRSLLHNP